MSNKPRLTGGVAPIGSRRIRFDFRIEGVRYRPSLLRAPGEVNLRRARAHLVTIKQRIATGTFSFADEFPDYHNPAALLESARIRKKDRPPIDPFTIQDAETLIAAIRQDWGEAQGNYDEFRFFTDCLRRKRSRCASVISMKRAVY